MSRYHIPEDLNLNEDVTPHFITRYSDVQTYYCTLQGRAWRQKNFAKVQVSYIHVTWSVMSVQKSFADPYLHQFWLPEFSQCQSQSYFMTLSVPPISSSLRQAPWDSRPIILFSNWTLAVARYGHVSQSVNKSWCRVPSGVHDQIFIAGYGLVFVRRPLWREDGSLFYICCWPCQRSLSRVRVPWDLRLYFTVSDLRLPFSSPPTTRRFTVEVFGPASTRVSNVCIWTGQLNCLQDNSSARTTSKIPFFYCCVLVRFFGNVFSKLFLINVFHNAVVLLLLACMLRTLPSNGRCLQSHLIATGLYATLLLLLLLLWRLWASPQ
jgi:hypothetical protein